MKKDYEKAVKPEYEKRQPKPVAEDGKPKEKTCCKCGLVKLVEDFPYQVKAKGYRSSVCRECNKTISKQYAADNRERCNKAKLEWKKANPEKLKEMTKRYAENHPDVLAQKSKRYRDRNPEIIAQYNKKYREENADFVRELKRRHRKDNGVSINAYRKKYIQNKFEQRRPSL